jgi:hypothetical protein
VHPDDSAVLVAEQVEALRATLASLDLPVRAVDLTTRTHLRIGFGSRTSEATQDIPGFGEVRLLGTMREEKLVLAMDCEGFDSQPPLAYLLEEDGAPLPPGRWPHDPRRRGIVRGHHLYGDRPFFCRPGTREFHTHRQHEDEPWDAFREQMTIDGIAIGILRDLSERWTIR